ncbi:MAG: hypothetical protein Ta2E_08240 [Mycoplasmoidaceae bacterium]|nr:MAG: hypothetical protein Ta2E_08240 [Mycoplasmoidaceae bacterium]
MNKKPKYYNIKKEYLLKVFTPEELSINKYEIRPFVGFDNTQVLVLLPEQTIHKKKKNIDLCYYFKDNKHILSISSLLFVPIEFRHPVFKWNTEPEFVKKLDEITNNYDFIRYKIYKCLRLNKYSTKFEKTHKQISKSKIMYDQHIKKLEKEDKKTKDLGMSI